MMLMTRIKVLTGMNSTRNVDKLNGTLPNMCKVDMEMIIKLMRLLTRMKFIVELERFSLSLNFSLLSNFLVGLISTATWSSAYDCCCCCCCCCSILKLLLFLFDVKSFAKRAIINIRIDFVRLCFVLKCL